jgi:resuscitation-promoting factor RpfB
VSKLLRKIHQKLKAFSKRHFLILPAFSLMAFVFLGLGTYISIGATTAGASDSYVVEIRNDDNTEVVPTRAKTIGELLKIKQITVGPNDSVSPTVDKQIVEDTLVIIEKARPILLRDGIATKRVIYSAAHDAKSILRSQSIAVFDEDIVSLSPVDDPLRNNLVAEELVIDRAKLVKLNLYGVLTEFRTHKNTVAELLAEKNIVLSSNDSIQPSNLGLVLSNDQLLSINVFGKSTTSVDEPLPFTVEIINDPTIDAGKSIVQTPGQNGQRTVIYEVETRDGVEVSRKELQVVVSKEPVKEVRLKGTKSTPAFVVTGDKAELMAAAGIPADQFASADYIINHESGWRVSVVNSIGCIGLAQRCPSGGSNALANECPNWESDPVCQLVHFSRYANNRYGGWNGAYQFWITAHWW